MQGKKIEKSFSVLATGLQFLNMTTPITVKPIWNGLLRKSKKSLPINVTDLLHRGSLHTIKF